MYTYKNMQYSDVKSFSDSVLKDINFALEIYNLCIVKMNERLSKYHSLDSQSLKAMAMQYTDKQIYTIEKSIMDKKRKTKEYIEGNDKLYSKAMASENLKKILALVKQYSDYDTALTNFALMNKCLQAPIEKDYNEYRNAIADYENQISIDDNIVSCLNGLKSYFTNLKYTQMS